MAASLAESNEITRLKEGYMHLSSPQRQCFAYCSLFPNDYKFDVPKLINLWAAEGYLASEHNSSVQCTDLERGQDYVRKFVEKSFFKDPKEDELGKIATCKMNPLIHGLAASITADNSIAMDPDGDAVHAELHRVSFHHSLDIPDSLFGKAKELKTILLPAFARSRLPDEVMMSNSTCERIFSTFKSLGVLDLHNLGIKVLPSSIGELKHLKHLDLSENNIERLPSSVTKLTSLERLKLSHCHRLKELPKDLKKLVSLKHLEIEGCLDLKCMPPEMNKLTSLETLSHFVVDKARNGGGLEELAELVKLTAVEILHLEQLTWKESNNNSQQYLANNKKLEVLTLRWDHQENVDKNKLTESNEKQLKRLWPHNNLKVFSIVGYEGKKLENGFTSFHSLVEFSLYNCPSCRDIPALHDLPELKVLKLQRLNSLQYIDRGITAKSISNEKFFKSLKKLSLWDCPELERWWEKADIEPKKFPCISELEVQHCPKLTGMPLFSDLDRKLILVSSSVEPLVTTLKDGTGSLSKLMEVRLSNYVEGRSPEDWIKKFTSLEKLHIRECPHLKSLPQGLTNLKSITVENCKHLVLSDGTWKGLKSLESLKIKAIQKLKSFPRLEDLRSLKDLEIHGCPELTCLPKEIRQLRKLETLIIRDCPLLLPRCQREIGDDWPYICHIKQIILT